eukprot:TRINITY_DN3943_c0_g1_i2.p1 TRINITY_DN3943_c0_g1~~TRINITY_DN3943_c0_g1_i2.p1  ORF type:complete len:567 (+),score=111.55 TRINITY_DN3943_c0_g1_i2:143-1843(+)
MKIKGALILATLLHLASASFFCDVCNVTVNGLHDWVSSKRVTDSVAAFAKDACTVFLDWKYCNGIVESYKPFLYEFCDLLNATILCNKYSLCTDYIITVDKDSDYLSRVLTSTPPRMPLNKPRGHFGTLKILVFNDVHLDPGYKENKSSRCDYALCCRHDSPDAVGDRDRAGLFGYLGNCDLPLITLDSFIDKAIEVNPDVMLWLGDNSGHNAHEQNENNLLDSFKYIADRLHKEYKGPVYFVMGNHEGYPNNQLDVFGNRTQWILNTHADKADYWYSKQGVESMRRYGRFSELVKGTSLRIIGLNNFVMDYTNIYLFNNATDAMGQLAWLEQELASALEKEESVIVIGHVAPQSISAERTWGYRYTALMEKYANIVRGQFFAHIHTDYFFLVKSLIDPSKTVNVVNIHPSLTTFRGLNPSFRVYEVDRSSGELLDYEQYRLNIAKANAERRAQWKVSYTFKSYFEVSSMEVGEYEKIFRRMCEDKGYLKKVYWMHFSEKPGTDVPRDQKQVDYMLCKYSTGNFYAFEKCVDGNYPKRNEYIRMVLLGKHIFPDWTIISNNTDSHD